MIRVIKNIFVGIVAMGLSTGAIINITTQYNTLVEARRLNAEYRTKIGQLDNENQLLRERIAYATSSAYLQQQAREMFGLGGENDYWLILPDNEDDINLLPRENVTENIPYWKQWLELFTR